MASPSTAMLAAIPSESLTQFLAHVRHQPCHHLLSCLAPGDIVEIQGGPSSGKTHILYHLIIDCIIPSQHSGWAKTAIVYDMDNTFEVARLYRLLLRRLAGLNVPAAESVAQRSLRRLQISRPSSTAELAVSLSHLTMYPASHLANEELGMVAIDSISSHYWPDRFVIEQMRSLAPAGSSHVPPLQHVLSAIKTLSESHRPLVVMTNWGLHSLSNTDAPSYRQHLQPFPTIFRDAGGAQPEQNITSPLVENMPNLTCHITLRRDTHLQQSLDVQQVQFSGLIRKSDSSPVENFLLFISTEDLVHKLISTS